MKTKNLLPYTRVTTHDLDPNVDEVFRTEEKAREFIQQSGTNDYNVFRIETVGGPWRKESELERP